MSERLLRVPEELDFFESIADPRTKLDLAYNNEYHLKEAV